MTKIECIQAMQNKIPVIIKGSYLFSVKPTYITKVKMVVCLVQGSNVAYEFHRIKKYLNYCK
jgi:hypothetical protein